MYEVIESETQRYYYRFEEIGEQPADGSEALADFGDGENSVFKATGAAPVPIGFWRGRFVQEQTVGQRSFDWIFGIILPVICFVCDPIVFRSQGGGALLGSYTGFAYSLGIVTIIATAISLLFGKRLGIANAALSGIFAASGTIALLVGLAILPFSVLGLLLLIGALGFTPLFSAFVMFRRSVVSLEATAGLRDQAAVVSLFMLSALSSVVIPYLVNVEFRDSVLSRWVVR